MAPSGLAVVFCLITGVLVKAQTTITIDSCADLPSEVTQDTVLELTNPEISCPTNTHIEVSDGASLEMTSAEASTKLNNVKIWLRAGNFLCTVPFLDWTSVETEVPAEVPLLDWTTAVETEVVDDARALQGTGAAMRIEEGTTATFDEDVADDDTYMEVDDEVMSYKFGAAMRIEEGSMATFAEDVTFSACAVPEADYRWPLEGGAAIANFGNLVFQGNTVFQDTPSAGALYTMGALTFEKDATFDNNKNNGGGFTSPGPAGGLFIDVKGTATFKGATFFTNNEADQSGAALYSASQVEAPMVFSGPVTVSGNSGAEGALYLDSPQPVIFESLVTFTDNIMGPNLDDVFFKDFSKGGAMVVATMWGFIDEVRVEFRGGVVATNNTARNGGVFYVDEGAVLSISEPVTIAGNNALHAGGVIYASGTVTMPATAKFSGNTAKFCPGITLAEGSDGYGEFAFEGGETYGAPTKELCYLGMEASASTPVDIAEEFDCDLYSASAPVMREFFESHPYLLLDTALVKSWDFGSGGGFSCGRDLMVVYVTGGGELTITSTAAASTLANVFFKVVGFTSLVLDVPDLTLTSVFQSQVGGFYVEVGSSLDVLNKIKFC